MNDEFTQRLLNIYSNLSDKQITSSVQLGIHRSDYMLNYDRAKDITQLLQVEINTIASSFGCLSGKMSDYHRFLLKKMEVMRLPSSIVDGILSMSDLSDAAAAATATASAAASATTAPADDAASPAQPLQALGANIPDNLSTRLLGFALAMGHFVYGNGADSVVLFIVQEGDRLLAYSLTLTHSLAIACR